MCPVSSLVWGRKRAAQSIGNNDVSIAIAEDNLFIFNLLKDCLYQVHMFDGRAAVQRAPELMVEWVERNIMKFVEDEVLQLGQKPPGSRTGWGLLSEDQLCQKGPGTCGGQQGALAAKGASNTLG